MEIKSRNVEIRLPTVVLALGLSALGRWITRIIQMLLDGQLNFQHLLMKVLFYRNRRQSYDIYFRTRFSSRPIETCFTFYRPKDAKFENDILIH